MISIEQDKLEKNKEDPSVVLNQYLTTDRAFKSSIIHIPTQLERNYASNGEDTISGNNSGINSPYPNKHSYKRAKLSSEALRDSQNLLLSNVGYRLSKRKDLHCKRRNIADIMFFLGALGIVLMMLVIELIFSNPLNYVRLSNETSNITQLRIDSTHISEITFSLKCLTSISTFALLVLIFTYHHLDMQLFCIDNSIEDMLIAITPNRAFMILVEILVCAIHPFPTSLNYKEDAVMLLKPETTEPGQPVPLVILLSVPMFARLYLFCRVIVLHSKLVTDASAQSLGYLNRISFNFRFVFKAYMNQYPEHVLSFLILLLLLIASWGMMACEYPQNTEKFSYFNSMWLIAITFLTVGYGDIYPYTYCGRLIAVLSGLFGVFCTALTVAVLTRKLEFTRAEKYVYQFVSEIELVKKLKHAAANIVKQGWLLYKLKKYPKTEDKVKRTDVIKLQRKLLRSIQQIREVKHEQRKMGDNAVTTLEVFKQNKEVNSSVITLNKSTNNIEFKINTIESDIKSLERNLKSVHDLLVDIKNKK